MLRFFNNTDVLSSNILNFTFSYTQEYSGKYGYKSTIMCKNNTILYDKPGRWSVYRSCRTSTDSQPRVMPRCCCIRSGSLLTSCTRLSPHPSAARPCPETSAQKQHPHKFSSSKTHYSSTSSALTLLVGCQEEHPACKNWVMRRWCGYLSGARLFACGPADATSIPKPHHLFHHLNPYNFKSITFLVLAYTGCPGKEAVKWV